MFRRLRTLRPQFSLTTGDTRPNALSRTNRNHAGKDIKRIFAAHHSTLNLAKPFENHRMRFGCSQKTILLILLLNKQFFNFSSMPEAQLIDGKKIAEDIRAELREQIRVWMAEENHRPPKLTAILIGDDPASRTYVNNKMKVMT